jgi:hypothetical protein
MKPLLLLLLLATPAAAQSINPIAYGQHFCALRRMHIAVDAARKAAVSYAYVADRNPNGIRDDASAAAAYVFTYCRDLVK